MYLAILKEEEKKAFLDFVYYVAASDGNVGEEEKNIIKAYCAEMMLEPTFDKPETECMQVIQNISNTANETTKKIIIFEILGLAMADGRYEESEKELIHSAAKQFELCDEFIAKSEQAINEFITLQEKINNLILK